MENNCVARFDILDMHSQISPQGGDKVFMTQYSDVLH